MGSAYEDRMSACTVFIRWMPPVPFLALMILSLLDKYMYLRIFQYHKKSHNYLRAYFIQKTTTKTLNNKFIGYGWDLFGFKSRKEASFIPNVGQSVCPWNKPSFCSGSCDEFMLQQNCKTKIHWTILETPLKLLMNFSWNTLDTFFNTLESSLKHLWNCLETPFKLLLDA